jgi:hypothetical protein
MPGHSFGHDSAPDLSPRRASHRTDVDAAEPPETTQQRTAGRLVRRARAAGFGASLEGVHLPTPPLRGACYLRLLESDEPFDGEWVVVHGHSFTTGGPWTIPPLNMKVAAKVPPDHPATDLSFAATHLKDARPRRIHTPEAPQTRRRSPLQSRQPSQQTATA